MNDMKGRRGDYISEDLHESKERSLEIRLRDAKANTKKQQRLV